MGEVGSPKSIGCMCLKISVCVCVVCVCVGLDHPPPPTSTVGRPLNQQGHQVFIVYLFATPYFFTSRHTSLKKPSLPHFSSLTLFSFFIFLFNFCRIPNKFVTLYYIMSPCTVCIDI